MILTSSQHGSFRVFLLILLNYLNLSGSFFTYSLKLIILLRSKISLEWREKVLRHWLLAPHIGAHGLGRHHHWVGAHVLPKHHHA